MPTGIYKRSKKHLSALHKGGIKSRFKKGHTVPSKWKIEWRKKIYKRLEKSRSFNFKGGQTTNRGYVFIWQPNHLRANYSQHHYVKRCILIMEKKIGRLLNKEEVVHHINGIKSDDNPDNLWLFKNRQSHSSYESLCRLTLKRMLKLIEEERNQ